MDAYIYDADIYCYGCGEEIIKELRAAGRYNTGDSDDWPQGPMEDGGGESDSPQHCGSREGCVNEIQLYWRKRPAGKVSAFLENPLTSHGEEYLCEMVSNEHPNDYQKALYMLWLNYYDYACPSARESLLEMEDRENVRIRRMVMPHGMCEKAGYCVEHERDESVEACCE